MLRVVDGDWHHHHPSSNPIPPHLHTHIYIYLHGYTYTTQRRDALARKLGFPSYAHRFTADKMAGRPEAVDEFLTALASRIKVRACVCGVAAAWVVCYFC